MQAVTAIEPKTPKRQPTRKPPKTETATKQKLTLYVSPEGAKRLGVHATMLGKDRSALVEQLISEHLKRFVVSDRAKPDANIDRQEGTGEKSSDVEEAA